MKNIFEDDASVRHFNASTYALHSTTYSKNRSEVFIISQTTKIRNQVLRDMTAIQFIELLELTNTWYFVADDKLDKIDDMMIRCEYNRRINKKLIPKELRLKLILSEYDILTKE